MVMVTNLICCVTCWTIFIGKLKAQAANGAEFPVRHHLPDCLKSLFSYQVLYIAAAMLALSLSHRCLKQLFFFKLAIAGKYETYSQL